MATGAVGVGIGVATPADGVNVGEGEAGTDTSGGDASEDWRGLRRAPAHPVVMNTTSPTMHMIRTRLLVDLPSLRITTGGRVTIVDRDILGSSHGVTVER